MAINYEKRLRIALEGNDHTVFITETGLHVATGYTRVVIGGRGPYVEFLSDQLVRESLHMPENAKYRTTPAWTNRVYYYEWRTTDESRVMVYEQKKNVDYADYKVGLFYIAPFDLYIDGVPVITKLRKKRENQIDLLDDCLPLITEQKRKGVK